jgi:hypothetical protein
LNLANSDHPTLLVPVRYYVLRAGVCDFAEI